MQFLMLAIVLCCFDLFYCVMRSQKIIHGTATAISLMIQRPEGGEEVLDYDVGFVDKLTIPVLPNVDGKIAQLSLQYFELP